LQVLCLYKKNHGVEYNAKRKEHFVQGPPDMALSSQKQVRSRPSKTFHN
jgi:hypothetical protein